MSGHLLPDSARAAIAAACPQFAGTFEIYVYWPLGNDPENPNTWSSWPWPFYGVDGILAFANAIMPSYVPGNDMYASSIMRRVCLYFGNDFSSSYYPFSVFSHFDAAGDLRISAFDLDILEPGSDSGFGYDGESDRGILSLGLPNGPVVSLDRMANDGFAHEWLHMIQDSNRPHWCCSLGGATAEYWAQCSEYLNGWFWLNPTDDGTRVELPFTRGPFAGDYYQACVQSPTDTAQSGHPEYLKHMTYSMFAPYLFEHYSLGGHYTQDAMHSWIQQKLDPEQQGDWPTRVDIKGLALLLGQGAYAPFFSSVGAEARVREVFQEFALSLWVNDPALMDSASVWARGASPSETHGYMVDFDGDCTNDVHTLPLYNVVTGTHKNRTDRVTLADLYPDSPACAGSPPYPRRALQVSTYGYNVLPFVAAPAIQNEALAYDLRVDVTVDDSYWCELSDEDVDAELTDNEVLHFYVLGYPEATEDLHEAGADAELINTYEFSDFDTFPTRTFSFSVGRFGVRYKSVVLLMTLTEKELEDGPRTAKVLPFDYSYWAEGHTAPITADTYWPSANLIHDGIVCLNGEVTVEAGAKLTIMPGTQVFCAAKAAAVGGVVGFDVEGVLQIGSPSGATVHVDPAQGTWTGISVANYAALSIFSSEISGFSEISAGSNATVDFSASSFELAEEAAGYALAGAGSAEVADCQFVGAGVFALGGSAQVGPHSLVSSQFAPFPNDPIGVAVILEDDAAVSTVQIAGSGPIRCNGGSISLSAVEAIAADVQSLLPKKGIVASGDADVLAEECHLSGFDQAISVDDAAMLTLRDSYLEGMQVGVMLNTTQVVDLGHDGSTPDSPYWGNNCFEMAEGSNCRTSLLKRNGTCSAEMNYWGAETPLASFFCGGGVDYQPYHAECPLAPPGGGGQYSFGIAPSGATIDEELRLAIYPNPGNPSVTIAAVLPRTGEAFSLAVYDVAGRLVRTLAAGTADGQEHTLIWDGTDPLGRPAGSGVYFVQIRVGARTAATQKLVLVR